MPLTRDQYFKLGCLYPKKNLDDESTIIKEKLKMYPNRKIEYIQYYINQNLWIKYFLYFDEFHIKEIDSLKPIGETFQKSIISTDPIRVMESSGNGDLLWRIENEISKAGGIIDYLINRVLVQLNEFGKILSGEINTNDDIIVMREDIFFLIDLAGLVKEILLIEPDLCNNIKQENDALDFTRENSPFFKTNFKKNFDQIFRCLRDMQDDGYITIKNWPDLLSGKEKITWIGKQIELLAFMQALQNFDLIRNYETDVDKLCEKINTIFIPGKPREREDGFNNESLANQNRKGRKSNTDSIFNKKLKYFEKKLKSFE